MNSHIPAVIDLTPPTEIIVIDIKVEDFQTLIDGAKPGVEVILIDGGHGLETLASALEGRSGIDSLHIVSHGSKGAVYLGDLVLNNQSLEQYARELSLIGKTLSRDGDLLLYGCDVGADGPGRDFATALAKITGADIALSDDLTGAEALGGDWDLEVVHGNIAALGFDPDMTWAGYEGTLADIALTTGNDTPALTNGDDAITADGVNLLNADDVIDGGGGTDILTISADQKLDFPGLVFNGTTLTNVEQIIITGGEVAITTHDATVGAGQTLTVDASGSADTLTWDGRTETDGNFNITGGTGNDWLFGGAGRDTISGNDGNDFICISGDYASVTGGSGIDTFRVHSGTYTGTIDGGTGDDLLQPGSTDFSGATLVNFKSLGLNNGGVTTAMTVGQFGQFTTVIGGSGTDTISLSGDGDFIAGGTSVEIYTVGDDSADTRTITVAAAGANITADSATDAVTFNAGGATLTGTLTGEGTNDILVLTDGADISSATLNAIRNLTLTDGASVTMAQAQHDAFTITAAGTQAVTISDSTVPLTGNAAIETYVLGAANTFTLGHAGQNLTGSSGNDTVNVGILTVTGTLTAGDGTGDTLDLGNGADISGATVTGFENLTIATNASVTMTADQLNSFTGLITAGGAETIVISATGAITGTNLSAIETISTVSGGSETITLTGAAAAGKTLTAVDTADDAFIITASAGGQNIIGSAGNDTIDGGAGTDTIAGGAGTDTLTGGSGIDQFKGSVTDLNGDTITDLAAGETILLTGVNGLSSANVRLNGTTLQIDTDATDFGSPEVAISTAAKLTIDSVADAGADTLITLRAVPAPPSGGGATPAPADDGDGATAAEEAQAPPINDQGTQGDGNGDGVSDSDQAQVVSMVLQKTGQISKAPDAPETYITLVADSLAGKEDTRDAATTTLKNVQQLDAPNDVPDDINMPFGLISFSADLERSGETETFSLYLDGELDINGYWKQNNSSQWVNLASEEYGGAVVTEGNKTRLDFKLTDGGEFDDDGQANGVIKDPGAPGIRAAEPMDIMRFYNPGNHLHMYSSSEDEIAMLSHENSGWVLEGISFQSNADSAANVHRFYNAFTGDHFFTSDTAEAEGLQSSDTSGYVYEGIAFQVHGTGEAEKAIGRYYNAVSGEHFYTTSAEEAIIITGQMDYVYEGILGYCI